MWPSAASESPELSEVLDDPVEDDGDLVVGAAGERVRVFVRDLPVGRPARVADTGGRLGSVRPGGFLQLVEVSDGANVLETLVFDETEPGRVIAAVLESLEPLQQKVLRSSRAHVSNDPAHSNPLKPLAAVRIGRSSLRPALPYGCFRKNETKKREPG